MRFLFPLALAFALALTVPVGAQPAPKADHPIAIVMHGGAGTIRREDMTPAQEAAYRAKMSEALKAGYAVLDKGGKALDAVEAAITVLEDSPLFNAGKGAVFTHNGKNELDSAIMDGATLNAGGVAAVEHVKNPIQLARLVMDDSPHVLLVGAGAETFARQHGVKLVPASYFRTRFRWQQLQKVLKQAKGKDMAEAEHIPGTSAWAFGTVGAAALDRYGHLAAGTSTGGLTNKRYGRVGDSPIIGAGTYANDATCAVSGTGHGEYYMRLLLTHSISDLMQYKGMGLKQAADEMVMDKLVKLGGEGSGGVIALDRNGDIAMPFNTEGMYRGFIDTHGHMEVHIYRDEKSAGDAH